MQFKVAIIGRSNSGKSTFISSFLDDQMLANSLHENNEKGKTKLNTQYCIRKDTVDTTFELQQNEQIIEFYINSDSLENTDDLDKLDEQNLMPEKVLEKIKRDFGKIIPDVKNIATSISIDDTAFELNEIIKNYLLSDKIKSLSLNELNDLSEKTPIIRNIIQLVIVHTTASLSASSILDGFADSEFDELGIIDTKGFGDSDELIEYDLPKADAVILMVADTYVDSDYVSMKDAISNWVNQYPIIICARDNAVNPNKFREILACDDISCHVREFKEKYGRIFKNKRSSAYKLQSVLYKESIIREKKNDEKSVMELYLTKGDTNDDLFRSLPYVFQKDEPYDEFDISEDQANDSKKLFDEVVSDILVVIMNAKIEENRAVAKLIDKLSSDETNNEVRSSILKIINPLILSAATAPSTSSQKEYQFFNISVRNRETFIANVHRQVHGPRGGTTGYYAYNYKRLARGSFVCLDDGFVEFLKSNIPHLNSIERELIARKVRRDICRYGKLSGEEGYMSFIDFNRLSTAYGVERYGDLNENPWRGHFEDYGWSYPCVREYLNKTIINYNSDFIHAASIYYGVIQRVISNAITDTLRVNISDMNNFAKGANVN